MLFAGSPSFSHQSEEVADEIGDVLAALAERRQADRHHVEAEEQVLAEQALVDQDAEVLVGGGDDADVGLDRRSTADGGVFALLEDAKQPGLGLHRHVADFVEEQRAALGLLESAGAPRLGAGEGALLVAEELGFDQVARNCRHVDRDERPVAPLAVVVERAGDKFLAGAGFARDHDGQVGLHQARQHPVDVLHRRRSADQRDIVGRLVLPVVAGGGCAAPTGRGRRSPSVP